MMIRPFPGDEHRLGNPGTKNPKRDEIFEKNTGELEKSKD